MLVSSVHAPAGSSNGPPPIMSSRRGSVSRAQNSSVVPTASPTARPRNAPSARSRHPSAVRAGAAGPRGVQPSTWASWDRFSMASLSRAACTRRIASSGRAPSSTSRRAATVPARPRPPLQWTSTSNPSRSRSRIASPATAHACSKSAPGGIPSGIGTCHHSMCRSRTASSRSPTPRWSISSLVIRLTTAVAPQSRITSRSVSRSRAVGPAIAAGSVLPGHSVMPIRPWPSPGVTEAMRSGLLSLVLVIGME